MMYTQLSVLLMLLFLCVAINAEETLAETAVVVKEAPPAPNLALAYYRDTREFDTMAIQYSSKNIPWGLQFWGFTDLHSRQNMPDDHDFSAWFTENRLTKMIGKGFGAQIEHNDAGSYGNNLLRFGVVYTVPIKGKFLQLRYHPLETDGNGSQASVVGSFGFFDKKFFVEGFYDHNFIDGASDRAVSELQLRYMLTDNLGLLNEYRMNEFMKHSSNKYVGVAFGLTYKF